MLRPRFIAGTMGLLGLCLGAAWGFQAYSVRDPWRPYTLTLRAYLDAGLHHDSATLARRAVDRQPIAWVHDAVVRRPATITTWSRQLSAMAGFRAGDTVTVSLAASTDADCAPLNSVTARFLDHSATPRLIGISSPCMDSDLPPVRPFERLPVRIQGNHRGSPGVVTP